MTWNASTSVPRSKVFIDRIHTSEAARLELNYASVAQCSDESNNPLVALRPAREDLGNACRLEVSSPYAEAIEKRGAIRGRGDLARALSRRVRAGKRWGNRRAPLREGRRGAGEHGRHRRR